MSCQHICLLVVEHHPAHRSARELLRPVVAFSMARRTCTRSPSRVWMGDLYMYLIQDHCRAVLRGMHHRLPFHRPKNTPLKLKAKCDTSAWQCPPTHHSIGQPLLGPNFPSLRLQFCAMTFV
ncbi:hypothetical protein F442_00484 [Phytophthora nicotianae P10297]|uniref:Uncharacterized protein n=3 Tax=Phytophthora nicotianae TaxID=4792 RepID=V9G1F3_PHYNI|nr:hypothetical protein F443_00497 [Phytophthora nicotianae P1569]ETK96904.1 hypothetical protein L915_00467 [Phytophthora nicotianae]ETL50250.1 hypothetical protein L916_00471 [Phytophthora nicotianae]ETM56577.1 hypothetical protein L914_00465 [Phytophthora nicotianae]ETP54887.1 hypothetical protein F442_00484 [Phytophthora nicotianae P10297]